MEIKQIYDYVNTATKETLGETVVVNEDLSNLVDIGTQVFNANSQDRYVHALMDRVGKAIFVSRAYTGIAPSIMMDGWEYGSVLNKISGQLPEPSVNESWELKDGQSYDPHVFHAPKGIISKFWNKYVTFDVDMSFTEDQLKSAFTSAYEMNKFLGMLFTLVENAMIVAMDKLKLSTIASMISETIFADYAGAAITTKSGVKAINLLKLYNDTYNKQLTQDTALADKDFIRFAAYQIKLVSDRLTTYSTTFNIGKQQRFTPKDLQHIILLSNFANSADIWLQSETFHNELTKLPNAERVNYWQGSGTDWSFGQVSKIDVKDGQGNTTSLSGILGVIFDKYALGVNNMKRKVTSEYTANAEFFTNFYKYKAQYFNDLNENFVVFFIA